MTQILEEQELTQERPERKAGLTWLPLALGGRQDARLIAEQAGEAGDVLKMPVVELLR